MFKKPFILPPGNKTSGLNRKRLRKNIAIHFPRMTEEEISEIFPIKEGELEMVKFKAPIQGYCYTIDNLPILIDITTKGDLIPSIYTLWKAPKALPIIYLKEYQTSKFILRGADLMLPGAQVDKNVGDGYLRGTIVSLCVPNNPMPFAVGEALMSSKEAFDRKFDGGKLVNVIHYYGDHLCKNIDCSDMVPDNFTDEMIYSHEVNIGEIEVVDVDNWEDLQEEHEDLDENQSFEKSEEEEDDDIIEDDISEEEEEEKTIEELKAEMDDLLEMCLFQSLKKSVKDEDLPLPASRLWIDYMKFNKYNESVVDTDVKKSSYKKMSKFLQAYGEKGSRIRGFLVLSEDKYSKETIINKIDRENEIYKQFRTYSVQKKEEIVEGNAPVKEFMIESKFKIGKELNDLLKAMKIPTGTLFTLKEIGELGFKYVKMADLDQGIPDKTCIVLDKILTEALFRGKIKKNEQYPTSLKKSDLRNALLSRMTRINFVARGAKQLIVKGKLTPIRILQTKRMGKNITMIHNIEKYLIDPDEFIKLCKKRFSCAATSTLVQKRGGQVYEIMIQGHVGQKLHILLDVEFEIPIQCITLKK